MPLHPPRPELGPDVPRWGGLPVTCPDCLRGGVPIMAEDGWRLPVHVADAQYPERNCSGSLRAVPT